MFGLILPTSPLKIHPSSVFVSFVFSGFLKYPSMLEGPQKQISPFGGLLVCKYPISGMSLSLILTYAKGPPT